MDLPTVFLWFSQVLPRVFSHFPIFSHNFPTFPMILLWIPSIFLGFSPGFPHVTRGAGRAGGAAELSELGAQRGQAAGGACLGGTGDLART